MNAPLNIAPVARPVPIPSPDTEASKSGAPRFTWPVIGHVPRETVAVFFEYGDAASFAMRPTDFGAERRNLYIGNPRYDTRGHGYRFEFKELPCGRFRVAA